MGTAKHLQQRLLRVAKRLLTPVSWLASLAAAISPAAQGPAQAQVVPTTTGGGAGTTVTESGGQYDIDGGTRAGGNLFHEFDDFSLSQSQVANFTSDSGVFNIVGQVSGANPSYIDGTVQVSGSDANLYLVNPSGVLFGPNAKLSLPGSFTATTADQVGFGEQWLTVAEPTSTDYTSLRSEPSAFRFSVEDPSAVVNQGDLAVDAGESISLIGGNAVSSGSVTAPGGDIALVGVGGGDTVTMRIPGSLLSLEVVEDSIPLDMSGRVSATTIPALLTGSPVAVADSLKIKPDGSVSLLGVLVHPEEVIVGGDISTRTEVDDGGAIALIGNSVDMVGSATLDASGENGGTIRVGGGQGVQGDLPDANIIFSRGGVAVRADGLSGTGGDVYLGASSSALLGLRDISATGTTQGGSVEISANNVDVNNGQTIDVAGQSGGGQWSVSSSDLEIVSEVTGRNQIDADIVASNLAAGVDVSLVAGSSNNNGTITLTDSINQSGGSDAALSLTGQRFTAADSAEINLSSTGGLTFDLRPDINAVVDASSIADAIAAIGDVAGDRTINLSSATYHFDSAIAVDTNVDIIGQPSASTGLPSENNTTTLSATNNNRLFGVSTGVELGLENLTLTRDAGTTTGGGIRNVGGNISIDNSYFLDNVALGNGGAIASLDGELNISNSEFVRNGSSGAFNSGGAISADISGSDKTSVINISGTRFVENTVGDDGGAIQVYNSTLSVEDSDFVRNRSTDDGGAISGNGSSISLTRTRFDDNSGQDGGAFTAWGDSTVDITDTIFTNNHADEDGGALHITNSTANITRSNIGAAAADVSGSTPNRNSAAIGGGIFAGNSSVTLIDSVVENNNAMVGGGLYSAGTLNRPAVITAQNTDFIDNTADMTGGAFYVASGSTVALANNRFTNNSAGIGGALSIYSQNVTDVGSIFTGNSAIRTPSLGGVGGAVAIGRNGGLQASGTTFTRNSAAAGGAISVQSAQNISLSGVTLTQNTAGDASIAGSGGGLYLFGGASIDIENSTFDSNHADFGGGGAIRSDNSTLMLSDLVFSNNMAAGGGALDLRGSSQATISKGTFLSNMASYNGGGIHSMDGSTLTLSDATFTENEAVNGGGIFSNGSELTMDQGHFTDNIATDSGGGIAFYDGRLDATNTTFTSNEANGDGGGLFVSAGEATVSNSDFVDNSAGDDGGGISAVNRSVIDMANTDFRRNSAASDGGAIQVESYSAATIVGGEISNNVSGDDGGGLYVSEVSQATISNTLVADNAATDKGGGLYVSASSEMTVDAVTVRDNSASSGGGLGIRDGRATVTGATVFSRNHADEQGGGIASFDRGLLSLSGTELTNNDAGQNGGGLYSTGEVAVIDSLFEENSALRGGGLAVVERGSLTLSDTAVVGNTASRSGGGVLLSGEATATISGTLTTDADGNNTSATTRIEDNHSARDGGGILLIDRSALVLQETLVRANTAGDDGGGLASTDLSTATVENSHFEGNQANDYGGGAYRNTVNPTAGVESHIAVSNSRFIANSANNAGGGLAVGTASTVAVTDSLFKENQAIATGGGIDIAAASATIESSQIISNEAQEGAGLALRAGSDAVVNQVSVSDNEASIRGGGVQVDSESRLQMTSSTLDGNRAVAGGGVFNQGTAEFVNTTLSGNRAVQAGGAISTSDPNANLSLRNSTVTQNNAGSVAGGVAENNTGSTRVMNTIIAANSSPTATDVSGEFDDDGNNLIGSVDGAVGFTQSEWVGSDRAPLDPHLAPLADNGGPTQTHLPMAGSLAIDTGNAENLPQVDQRGSLRFSGSAVDIGAVELSEQERTVTTAIELVQTLSNLLDPTVIGQVSSSTDGLLMSPQQQSLSPDDVSIQKIERSFSQSFKDYWDLDTGADLTFSDIQAILRRAQEERAVNSAVIYAIFAAPDPEEPNQTDVLRVEPAPSGDDLLNLSVVLPEGELVSYQLPVTRREASRQVRLLRSVVSDPYDATGHAPFTQQLYQWLLAPIEEDLAAQNIQNLMYALDSGLRSAPIAAMRDYNGYSLERYGISVVPSMSLMQAEFPAPVRRSTVAMGVAEFEDQPPLPAVPIELDVLKSVVPASSSVLNEATTSTALANVQALEQPGVLHLATHASFDNRSPESSLIHLWNEDLSMRDFSQLGWDNSDLEMLILSACSTALSGHNSELGFAGLAAAAGVDATVGSLWEVSDVGTLALMSEFYAQLEKTALRGEALRNAQLALLRGDTRIENGNLLTSIGEVDLPDEWGLADLETLDHPFFWSAFTMVGNPW